MQAQEQGQPALPVQLLQGVLALLPPLYCPVRLALSHSLPQPAGGPLQPLPLPQALQGAAQALLQGKLPPLEPEVRRPLHGPELLLPLALLELPLRPLRFASALLPRRLPPALHRLLSRRTRRQGGLAQQSQAQAQGRPPLPAPALLGAVYRRSLLRRLHPPPVSLPHWPLHCCRRRRRRCWTLRWRLSRWQTSASTLRRCS